MSATQFDQDRIETLVKDNAKAIAQLERTVKK